MVNVKVDVKDPTNPKEVSEAVDKFLNASPKVTDPLVKSRHTRDKSNIHKHKIPALPQEQALKK